MEESEVIRVRVDLFTNGVLSYIHVIRHLIMPNHVECCTKPVLDWIARNMRVLMAFSANTTLAGGYGFGSVICPNKLVFNNEQIQFQANKSKSDGIRSIPHATGKHYLYVDFGQLAHLVFHILSDFGPGKGITLPPHYIKW